MFRFATLTAVLLAFLPSAAAACPVCGFGEDESRVAYIGTTVFLSVLPVALIVGFVLYVRRLMKVEETSRRGPARPL
jgi:hypothetical protein